MDSLTFKKLNVDFEFDMQTILEDLELAVDGDLGTNSRQKTVVLANGKLMRYGEILVELAALDEKRRQFESRFGEMIEDIRAALSALK